MKLIISFTFLFFTLLLSAQNTSYKPYQFPEKVPSEYIFDVKSEYSSIAQLQVNNVKQRDIYRFAELSTYGKKELFTSGKIYLGWKEIEDYLNKILQQILPHELKGKQNMHVFLARSSESNAYAIHDGTIFVNIGLLAEVVNEAGLAIIIAHEVAHYIHRDPLLSFTKGLKIYTKKNRNKNLELKLDKAVYDRIQEKAADSLGFILAENAGYNVYYGISNFMQFQEIEELEKTNSSNRRLVNVVSKSSKEKSSSVESSIEKLLRTHPELTERVEFLKKFLSSANRKKETTDFIVSKTTFNDLQQSAKKESIYLLLYHNNFKECARRSFVYHLLDPENNEYIYYLAESLRRLQYVEKRIHKEGFLTENINFNKKGNGVLYDLSLVIRDSSKMASIKATQLADTSNIEFETYEETFVYFAKLAVEKNIIESYLTLALYNITNDSLKKIYLEKYIAKPDAEHKKYAELLLTDNLYKSLEKNTRQILLLEDLTFIEDHFYGYHNRQLLAEERSPEYIRVFKKMISRKFPEKELILLNTLAAENMRQKILFEEATVGSAFSSYNNNSEEDEDIEKTSEEEYSYKNKTAIDFFILNPKFWEVFSENNLQALNYLNVTAFDDKTKMMKLFNVINPCFWYYFWIKIFIVPYTGSARFAHLINYYHFDIKNKNASYYSEQTKYKMTKPNFLNSIFYAIKNTEQ